VQPFLSRRSLLGGILAACTGLPKLKSPLRAAVLGVSAGEPALGSAECWTFSTARAYVGSGSLVTSITYNQEGRVIGYRVADERLDF
jgi:hypothetical protein